MRTSLITSLLCLSLISCGASQVTLVSPDGTKKITVPVELALNEKDRETGLMNRAKLDPQAGMLFVMPGEQMVSFWMKDTKIPLDMLFFDKNGELRSAEDNAQPCIKNPCSLYTSKEVTKYILETNAGFRLKNGIGVGWKFDVKSVPDTSK